MGVPDPPGFAVYNETDTDLSDTDLSIGQLTLFTKFKNSRCTLAAWTAHSYTGAQP